jgi:hypothetical protein
VMRDRRRGENLVGGGGAEFAMFVAAGIAGGSGRRALVVQAQAGAQRVRIGRERRYPGCRKAQQNKLQGERIGDEAARQLPPCSPLLKPGDAHAPLSRGDYHTRR